MLVQHVHQLGEGGGDVDPLLVLDALQPLAQHLLHDHGVLLQIGVVLLEVQEQGDEGGLAVGGHEGVDLVLDGLDTAFQLVPQPVGHQPLHGGLVHLAGTLIGDVGLELLPAFPQVLAQVAQVHALSPVLVGGHAGDDLGHDGAGHLEALGGLDELAVHHRAVVQHVPDVDEAAVEDGLDEVVGVVEVDGPLVVGLGDLLGQEDAPGQVPAHLAGDIVPLGGGDHGVLVGVLLGQLLVLVAQQGEDGLVGGVGPAHQGPVIAVDDIGLGQVELVARHQALLHQVLDVLHQHPGPLQGLDAVDDGVDVCLGQPLRLGHLGVGLADGGDDLGPVIVHDGPVPLDDFHGPSPLPQGHIFSGGGAPGDSSGRNYSTSRPACPLYLVARPGDPRNIYKMYSTPFPTKISRRGRFPGDFHCLTGGSVVYFSLNFSEMPSPARPADRTRTRGDRAMTSTIAVAMSGGVDSAAAACLLREEGAPLLGLTMRLLGAPTPDEGDAARTARALGFPHRVLDLSGPFREKVDGPLRRRL